MLQIYLKLASMENISPETIDKNSLFDLFESIQLEEEQKRSRKIEPVICNSHFYSQWISSEDKFSV
jgi:hypothetical protein